MEDQSWRRFSALSRRHQGAFQPRIDLYMGFGDVDSGADDSLAEFACPFCFEDFDIVGLCGHIDDEHRGEAKNEMKRRRSHRGSLVPQSPLSLLKKELREGHVQSLLGEFSRIVAPSSAAPDPLLSSFISNLPTKDSTKPVQLQASGEGSQRSKKLEDNRVAKSIEQEALSVKDKEEKARKSRFVRELVLSAMLHVTTL